MDDKSYRLQIVRSINEYKAHRLNRTEQCRFEVASNNLDKERCLTEREFNRRVKQIKRRQSEMLTQLSVGSGYSLNRRLLSRSISMSTGCGPQHGRSKSALIREDNTTNVVQDYDVFTKGESAYDVKDAISQQLSKRCLSRNSMVGPHGSECGQIIGLAKPSIPRKIIMQNQDNNRSVLRVFQSARSRREAFVISNLEKKLGNFVTTQETFNKENPVDSEITVQREQYRLHWGSRVKTPCSNTPSRREAIIIEVLQKLGLDTIETKDNESSLPFIT